MAYLNRWELISCLSNNIAFNNDNCLCALAWLHKLFIWHELICLFVQFTEVWRPNSLTLLSVNVSESSSSKTERKLQPLSPMTVAWTLLRWVILGRETFNPIYLNATCCDSKKYIVVTLMFAVATEMGQYTLPYSIQLYKIWLLELWMRWLLKVFKEELQNKTESKKIGLKLCLVWFFELSLWLITTSIQKGFQLHAVIDWQP